MRQRIATAANKIAGMSYTEDSDRENVSTVAGDTANQHPERILPLSDRGGRAAAEAKDARQQDEEQKSIVDDRKSNGVIKRIAAGLVIGSHSSAMWSMQSRGGIDLLK